MTGSVEHGVVYVDGLGVGDVGQVVLRDRQVLAQDGIATVVVTIDSQTGRLMSDPELITRGLAWGTGRRRPHRRRTGPHQADAGQDHRTKAATDQAVIKKAVHDSVSQLLWERTRSRPMVIPVVVEV